MNLRVVGALLVVLPSAFSAIFQSASDLSSSQWDYVIVGGGTAGSVVANRLSEDPTTRVLVIEAGGLDSGPDAYLVQVPFLVSGTAPNTRFDWNLTTTRQKFLGNRTLTYPRGHVIGGSSSINFMAYTRGSSQEFDRLATVTGDVSWSWDNMLPYILKNERIVSPADKHDTTGQYTPAYHGVGPLLTSLPGNPTDLDHRVLNTTAELSSEFPLIEDMNSGNTLGIGWLQSTVGSSVRSSASTAFLTPAVGSRGNIDLLVNTHVTRILQTGTSRHGSPTFLGVEFTSGPNGKLFNVAAKKEVVLAAGSVATPTLLMLSGLGPAKELKKHGIKPVVDVPDVGNNLQDHAYVTLQWAVNSTKTFDELAYNKSAFAEALDYYQKTGTGIMANNAIANHIGFFRLPDSSPVLKKYGDPSSGSASPHFEFAFCNGFVGTGQTAPTSGNYFSTAIVLVSPTSRGSILLSSSSPFDHPIIDPNFMSTASDRKIMVESVKSLKHFLTGTSWTGYLLDPFGDTKNIDTDEGIEAYWRSWTDSIRHPVGTARIAKWDSSRGVVNPDLTMKQVSGIRIVDASILPFAPGAHPQAMIYAVAERASDLIKAEHL